MKPRGSSSGRATAGDWPFRDGRVYTLAEMRACSIAQVVVGLAFVVATTAASCAGTQTDNAGTSQPDSSAPPTEAASVATATAKPTAGPLAPEPEGDASDEVKRKAARWVAACQVPTAGLAKNTDAADVPASGSAVVMNNAQTAASVGKSDRFQPLVEAITSKRSLFRCCFDTYAKDNPGAHGKLTLSVKLDPSGKLLEAKTLAAQSELKDPVLGQCVAQTAKSVSFPTSPSGKETLFQYPFTFNAAASK